MQLFFSANGRVMRCLLKMEAADTSSLLTGFLTSPSLLDRDKHDEFEIESFLEAGNPVDCYDVTPRTGITSGYFHLT